MFMPLSDLPRKNCETDDVECYQHERTPLGPVSVQLTAAGLSIRETTAVLGLLGVGRLHGAD